MVQRTTQGTLNPTVEKLDSMRKDLSVREFVVVAPLIALVLFLGFYPKPVLNVINPAVQATFHDIGKTDPKPTVAQGDQK
jgi:NADH-quinone oxidoreductase subunit M